MAQPVWGEPLREERRLIARTMRSRKIAIDRHDACRYQSQW
jgi:hypothetical protein